MSSSLFVPYTTESNPSCCNGTLLSNNNRKTAYACDDADIAKEMNQLSVEEREKVYDDIHGVSKIVEETPDFVQRSVEAMDQAILQIRNKDRREYNRAIFLKPNLQTDSKFKLMFLRTDAFHPTRAANRMVQYFAIKQTLFGEDKLVKRITMDDLTDDEIYTFKRGSMLTLPVKDQSGRQILFYDTTKAPGPGRASADSDMRCFLYQLMAAITGDETSQRKRLCAIYYCPLSKFTLPGYWGYFTELAMRSGHLLLSCLPVRFTGYHFCSDDHRMDAFVKTMRLATGTQARLRLRAHVGSSLELEYFLVSFGIQCPGLFGAAEGGDTTMHEQYIHRRREVDQQEDENERLEESTSGIILYPKPKDVLIGKGYAYHKFSGSVLWSDIIYKHLPAYMNTSTRFEKTCLTMNVVKAVLDSKGRFLQRAGVGWKVLEEQVAREKTAAAFLYRIKLSTTASGVSAPPSSPMMEGYNLYAKKRPRLSEE